MSRTTLRRQAICLWIGDMVVTPGGGMGVLLSLDLARGVVTHGAAGPTSQHSWRSLRVATRREIMDAGLHGVGCTALEDHPTHA